VHCTSENFAVAYVKMHLSIENIHTFSANWIAKHLPFFDAI